MPSALAATSIAVNITAQKGEVRDDPRRIEVRAGAGHCAHHAALAQQIVEADSAQQARESLLDEFREDVPEQQYEARADERRKEIPEQRETLLQPVDEVHGVGHSKEVP